MSSGIPTSSTQTIPTPTAPEEGPSSLSSALLVDRLRIVGYYRRGFISKTDAVVLLCERAAEAAPEDLGERNASSLIAPYHKMLDTFDKEMARPNQLRSGHKEGVPSDPGEPSKGGNPGRTRV
jgi:hypothetical protein